MNGVIYFFIAVFVVAIAGLAFMIGREKGRDEIIDQQERDTAQAEKDREKIEEDVKKRPDEQIDKDIGKWFRD